MNALNHGLALHSSTLKKTASKKKRSWDKIFITPKVHHIEVDARKVKKTEGETTLPFVWEGTC